MPELFEEILEMGEKKVTGMAENRQRTEDQPGLCAVSLESDALSQHSFIIHKAS